MRHWNRLALALLLAGSAVQAQSVAGLTEQVSPHSFSETLARLEKAADSRGLKLFARLDHAAAAKEAGLTLRPTTVLVIGNPKGGTGLMQAQPTLAIDLPLKVLVWQADDGKVRVATNGATYYQRHGVPDAAAANLAGIAGLVETALK